MKFKEEDYWQTNVILATPNIFAVPDYPGPHRLKPTNYYNPYSYICFRNLDTPKKYIIMDKIYYYE